MGDSSVDGECDVSEFEDVIAVVATNFYSTIVLKSDGIVLAPEMNGFDEILGNYSAIQSFLCQSSRVSLSEYKGTIHMDICRKCPKKQ